MSTKQTSADTVSPAQQIFEMIWPGGLAAQAIYCAARLGLADLLADGPLSAEAIAERAGTYAPATHRWLRALCSLNILQETPVREFELTDLGQTLSSGDASAAKPWAAMLGAPFIWRPWGKLLDTLKTGQPAFPDMYGHSWYEFLAEHPEDAEIYNEAMNAGAELMIEAVVKHYDFDQFHTIVDLGGGRGALLRGILQAHAKPRGILFDLPPVVATADALLRSSVADRCETVGGDFFEEVPQDADAYLMKGIVHGFNDENAVKILKKIHSAMCEGGKLLIVDAVLQETNEPNPQKAMMDLMMLSLVEGRERTEKEFSTLLGKAGFELSQVIDTGRGSSIVEGIPV